MKRFFSYIGALLVTIAGLWVVSRSRQNKKLADSLEEQKAKALGEQSAGALKKADAISKKVDAKMKKAKDNKQAAEAIAQKLEKQNETSLAARVRTFNDSL